MLMLEGNILITDKNPREGIAGRSERKRLFLVCDYCFWAASALPTRKIDLFACPECSKPISSMALSDGGRYSSENNDRRGLGVESAAE